MKILVIIVTYNFEKWINRCLGSLRKSDSPVSIVVIDNCSQDDTTTIIERNYPEVHLIKNKTNIGFGQANNIGMKIAIQEDYDAVFLLNQDAWVEQSVISTLAELSQTHPSYGVLSPVHLTGKGGYLDSGFVTYSGIQSIDKLPKNNTLTELPFVNAAFWMIPVSVLKTVGGFSSLFYHYGEDVDFINRLHYHGYKIGYAQVFAFHDREMRTSTRDTRLRADTVYWLAKCADINSSLIYALGKSTAQGSKKMITACLRGAWNDAAAYTRIIYNLLCQSNHIRKVRSICRTKGCHFIIK